MIHPRMPNETTKKMTQMMPLATRVLSFLIATAIKPQITATANEMMQNQYATPVLGRELAESPDNRHLWRVGYQLGAQLCHIERRRPTLHGNLAERFHHARQVYVLGTAAHARLARCARPHRLRLQYFVQAQLGHANDLVRQQVKRERHRAA